MPSNCVMFVSVKIANKSTLKGFHTQNVLVLFENGLRAAWFKLINMRLQPKGKRCFGIYSFDRLLFGCFVL